MDQSFLRAALLLLTVHTALTVGDFITSPSRMVQCNQNVSLLCQTPSSAEVSKVQWAYLNTMTILCNSTKKDENYKCTLWGNGSLELTILGFQPGDQGDYVCKIQSVQEAYDIKTSVTLDENHGCYTDASWTRSADLLACTFSGVFPEGEVHWFQDSTKLLGITTVSVEPRGGLTIKGTLKINSTSGQQPYNCSLWNPRTRKYVTSKLLTDKNLNPRFIGNGTEAHRAVWGLGAILLVSHMLIKLWA